jgi:hypothetical protein
MRFTPVVLFVASFSSFASLSINPTIGMNYAWFDEYPIFTPNAGIDMPIAFNRNELSMGLHYSPKGSRYDGDYLNAEWFHYAEIPIICSYYPTVFKKRVGLNAGCSFSYLFAASIEDENGFKASSTLKSMYRAFDLGGLIGIRYNQSTGTSLLNVSVNYYHGIVPVRNVWDDMIIPKWNHAITLLIGYAIPFSK